jgi:hypothetical protein
VEHGDEVGEYAQMWRITDDHWDVWTAEHKSGAGEFPFGVRDAFDRLAKWVPYVKPGNWPDDDMLPWGWLGPHPGWGEPRQSRETKDEQRTEFTLWAMTRSPLILGANLTRLDEFTRSLITNQTLLFIDQASSFSRPVDAASLGAGFENARVWRATINEAGARGYAEYFAFFNLGDAPVTLRTTWNQLGLAGNKHQAEDVFTETTGKESKEVSVTLPAHGSTVFEGRLRAPGGGTLSLAGGRIDGFPCPGRVRFVRPNPYRRGRWVVRELMCTAGEPRPGFWPAGP